MGKDPFWGDREPVIDGRSNGCCYDREDKCIHCRACIAAPHKPTCRHRDEPTDECDATSGWGGKERVQAFIELRGHEGLELVRRAVETLQASGFDVAGRSVPVFRKGDGPPEWIGLVSLPERA